MSLTEHNDNNSRPEKGADIEISAPYYTWIMTAGLIVVFLCQLSVGVPDSIQLVSFDKQAFLNHQEMWRLLTGLVTHGSLPHIFFNAYAMFSFGRLVETLSNRSHLPTIFFISGISGSLLSLLLNPTVPVIGASGGIIGMLGYVAIYALKRKQFLDPAFRRSIFVNIGFIAVFGLLLFDVVDNYGHLGGIVAGALYGLVQIPSDPAVDPRPVSSIMDGVGFVGLGAFIALCTFTSLYLLNII